MRIKMILLKEYLLFTFLLFASVSAGDVGDKCFPYDYDESTTGTCTIITDCAPAINEIISKNHHTFKRCGFYADDEIVCCPQEPESKYGDKDDSQKGRRRMRPADRECKKIVAESVPPLALHIIGGEEAGLGEFPHMVALGYPKEDEYDFQCGGTLISNLYIVSAAHCVDNLEKILPTIARMGVVELGDAKRHEESDIGIAEIIKHPMYARSTKYNDLVLLRLEKPAQFSPTLNPACLYTSLDDPKIPLTVTGWGKTSNTRNIRSNILLKANVTVVAREKCGDSYTGWRKLPRGISEEQICAGDPEGLKDSCQGDSGGPLQGLTANDGYYRLVGVTSFGRGCGSTVPAVYTRVARYLDWIESVVWPNAK